MTTILVSGANGFLGCHAVAHVLEKTDWDVTALCRIDYAGDIESLVAAIPDSHRERVRFVYHDLCFEVCDRVAERLGRPDYILHLAAASHVDRSIADPREFVMSNCVGTLNLLEYARQRCPKSRFLNFGTDECYGPGREGETFDENSPWNCTNPYSASKVGQVALGLAYFKSYGLPVLTTFCMNLYGANQHPEKFVPKVISLLKSGKPVEIHCDVDGDGHVTYVSRRHWLHARDAVGACLFLFEHGTPGEKYNIASDVELNNDAMAYEIAAIIGIEKPDILYVDAQAVRPGYDRQYTLDGGKLNRLGWVPTIPFVDGLWDVVKQELGR